MTMSPAVCFSRPAIIRKRVVLPHPDGPRRTRNSPSRTARSTPSTAVWSPHSLRSAFVSTMAIRERYSSLRSFHFAQILFAFSSASLSAPSGCAAPVATWANMVLSTQLE